MGRDVEDILDKLVSDYSSDDVRDAEDYDEADAVGLLDRISDLEGSIDPTALVCGLDSGISVLVRDTDVSPDEVWSMIEDSDPIEAMRVLRVVLENCVDSDWLLDQSDGADGRCGCPLTKEEAGLLSGGRADDAGAERGGAVMRQGASKTKWYL